MTDFGDFTDDDAFDTAPADPEQVAIKLHAVRQALLLEERRWDALDDDGRWRRIEAISRLLAWWRREGLR